jgi:hypothetical protein
MSISSIASEVAQPNARIPREIPSNIKTAAAKGAAA